MNNVIAGFYSVHTSAGVMSWCNETRTLHHVHKQGSKLGTDLKLRLNIHSLSWIEIFQSKFSLVPYFTLKE